jgi:hypothetical protein
MTYLDAVALDLATKHAIAAGIREPWTWATEHAAEFLEEAAAPMAQEQYERETDAAMAEYDAYSFLADIFAGPAPPAGAPLEEHVAYALRLEQLMPPVRDGDD